MRRNSTGFTMVEIVVMMAIIVTISGMVLVSFGGLHEGAAVNRSARELGLAIRKIQNVSLSITHVDTLAGPQIPRAVGMRLTQGAFGYTLFLDQDLNKKYDPGSNPPDAKLTDGDQLFDGHATISSLKVDGAPAGVVYVIFATPYADMVISDQNGALLGDTLEMTLTGPSGQIRKKVTVRTSGQVSIQ